MKHYTVTVKVARVYEAPAMGHDELDAIERIRSVEEVGGLSTMLENGEPDRTYIEYEAHEEEDHR